jgi:hypothetical protein
MFTSFVQDNEVERPSRIMVPPIAPLFAIQEED